MERGGPCSSRVKNDYNLALDLMHILYKAGGKIVAELENSNSVRYIKRGTGNHGGVRVKVYLTQLQLLDSYTRTPNEDKENSIVLQNLCCGSDSSKSKIQVT